MLSMTTNLGNLFCEIRSQATHILAYKCFNVSESNGSILHNTALLQSRNVLGISQGHFLKVKTGFFICRSEQSAGRMPAVLNAF